MKINIKIIAIILAIALVLIEGYLIASSILDKVNTDNQIKSYCNQKCFYDKNSFFWEFTGEDGISKGFTTPEECFNYCSQVKQGFAASLLNAILNLTK